MKRLQIALLVVPLLATTACVSVVPMRPRASKASDSAVVLPNVPTLRWGDMSCGAGALATVLNHYGDAVTQDELDAILPKAKKGGVLSVDLVLEAQKRGFDAEMLRGTEELIRSSLAAGVPPVLMIRVIDGPGSVIDFYHFVVIDGYDPQSNVYRMQFGDANARWVSLEKIRKAWAATDNATLLVRKKDPAAEALQARMRSAVALEAAGNPAAALEIYNDLARTNPSSALLWTNIGNAESALSHSGEAEAAYRKAIQIDSKQRDALNNLAWLLLTRNRLEEAEWYARRAVDAGGDDTYLRHETLAQVLAARGKCADATAEYETAISTLPASNAQYASTLLLGKASALRACHRDADAEAALRQAAASNPDEKTRVAIAAALAELAH